MKWYVHLHVRGTYCGAYEFDSRSEAIEFSLDRTAKLGALGCTYFVNQHAPEIKLITRLEQTQ